MINIRLSDCEAINGHIKIRINEKGKKERKVYIETELNEAIREEYQGEEFLFETKSAKQLHRRNVSSQVRRAGLRAGRIITSHDFR